MGKCWFFLDFVLIYFGEAKMLRIIFYLVISGFQIIISIKSFHYKLINLRPKQFPFIHINLSQFSLLNFLVANKSPYVVDYHLFWLGLEFYLHFLKMHAVQFLLDIKFLLSIFCIDYICSHILLYLNRSNVFQIVLLYDFITFKPLIFNHQTNLFLLVSFIN